MLKLFSLDFLLLSELSIGQFLSVITAEIWFWWMIKFDINSQWYISVHGPTDTWFGWINIVIYRTTLGFELLSVDTPGLLETWFKRNCHRHCLLLNNQGRLLVSLGQGIPKWWAWGFYSFSEGWRGQTLKARCWIVVRGYPRRINCLGV